MGSRREEERNEKIIRGLMKLPPNRSCINCNSLGPQYVCTNFWTFVCTNCSGVHREFTHRVKSVSMSKFTSQEVEALQNGGNQRAREAFFKSWDMQRQRLPNSSDADKIREFIKSVYVDKKYAGGKTLDKPPRDTQSIKNHEDDFRRASSYHSYSQSPPYDYQYEDRHYGKQAPVLTRRPGSDRGYVGKISSFVYSPDRLSDYSVSSGADPFRPGMESPNFQKDIGFGSLTMTLSRDAVSTDAQTENIDLFADSNFKRDVEAFPHHQRSSSLRSIASVDSSSISLRSSSSGNGLDIVSEVGQTAGTCKDKISASEPSVPANYGGLDLFNLPEASRAPENDPFQSHATSFEPASIVPVLSTDLPQQAQNTASIDLFGGITEQPSGATFDSKIPNSAPKNEGWATFDTPPGSSDSGRNTFTIATRPSEGSDQFVPFNLSGQWPSGVYSSALGAVSSISSSWNQGFLDSEVPPAATNAQLWSAFDGSAGQSSSEPTSVSELQVPKYKPSETLGQQSGVGVIEDVEYGNRKGVPLADHSGPSLQPVIHMEASCPLTEEMQSQVANHKSSNPFDLPYDSNLDETNMFLDMTSLQFALPNNTLQSPFLAGVSPEYPVPVTSFIPSVPQGGLAYMTGPAQSSQLPSVQSQGHVTSIGGNPFP